MSTTKSTVLNLRLDPEDKAWLEAQVEELGLDNVSAVMRSLIRRAQKGKLDAPQQPKSGLDYSLEAERRVREEEERARKEAERKRRAAELRAQLAELEGGAEPRDHIQDLEDYVEMDRALAAEEFEVPADADGGEPDFKPIPTGFKPPGSLARPAGASNGLVGDRSPGGESIKRNYSHLLPR